jgi:hypothetical protein
LEISPIFYRKLKKVVDASCGESYSRIEASYSHVFHKPFSAVAERKGGYQMPVAKKKAAKKPAAKKPVAKKAAAKKPAAKKAVVKKPAAKKAAPKKAAAKKPGGSTGAYGSLYFP